MQSPRKNISGRRNLHKKANNVEEITRGKTIRTSSVLNTVPSKHFLEWIHL